MYEQDMPRARQPVFNLPSIVTIVAVVLIVIHLLRVYALTAEQDRWVMLWFSFLPVRYEFDGSLLTPEGWPAKIWTFVTYALLHGDFTHLFVNVLWMAAFGSALARRFGSLRFVLFSVVCAIGGAALHLVFFWQDPVPVIGASAAISGHMAGVARFGFVPGGPLDGRLHIGHDAKWGMPAHSIVDTFRDRRALIFLGVWFAVNFLFGIGGGTILGEGVSIAWQAHVGGFVAGLLLFRLFDPVPPWTPRSDLHVTGV